MAIRDNIESEMKKIYYVHDPMCSWCWGFKETLSELENALPDKVELEYVVGGLAPDSDQPMPEDMQLMLQNTWRTIEERIPGTEFNFDFWTKCKPRRSTYPACRAVLAAKQQGAEKEMIDAIQYAYYQEAKNPSDNDTLESLAVSIGLNSQRFKNDFYSPKIQQLLIEQIEFGRSIGAQGFPSLIIQGENNLQRVNIDYNSAENILAQL